MVAPSEYFLNAFSSSNGQGGMVTTTPTWYPFFVLSWVSFPWARSLMNAPHSLVIPSIWMLIVGYPKRHVHSRGQIPFEFAMQLMSM